MTTDAASLPEVLAVAPLLEAPRAPLFLEAVATAHDAAGETMEARLAAAPRRQGAASHRLGVGPACGGGWRPAPHAGGGAPPCTLGAVPRPARQTLPLISLLRGLRHGR